MSDADNQEYLVTVQDVENSLLKNYCWRPSKVVISKNRENAFVKIDGTWQKMDLTEDWVPRSPVPDYIPAEQIEHFYRWLDVDRHKAEQIGRKIGEQAMGAAIRGLIGAAALVDLERVERDHDREG